MPPMACPICDGDGDPFVTTTDRNRGIGDERFEYRTCRSCATVYLANPPADLGSYYPPEYYDLDRDLAPSQVERAKLDIVQRHVDGGRLVEIGPGTGEFAAHAKRSGFDVTTIEMDERACRHLREVVGVECVRSDRPHEALAAMPPSRAVVLWHVLEHLPDPAALLDAAAANLEPGGVLVAAVPNPQAFQLRVMRMRWPHIDAPRHLVLMPAHTLLDRGRRLGLEPVALTSRDRAGCDWNVHGWQHAMVRPGSGPRHRRAAFYAGALLALALAPIERGGLRGSTYTAVLRQDGAR